MYSIGDRFMSNIYCDILRQVKLYKLVGARIIDVIPPDCIVVQKGTKMFKLVPTLEDDRLVIGVFKICEV